MTRSRPPLPKCLGGGKLLCKDTNPVLARRAVGDIMPVWRLGMLRDCMGVNWERTGFPWARTTAPSASPSLSPNLPLLPGSQWVTPMGRQGSSKENSGTPGKARAALTCVEGDKAPCDEGGDAMGQPPHAPCAGVPHGPPPWSSLQSPPGGTRGSDELRWWWEWRLSRESHHRGPLTACPACPHC